MKYLLLLITLFLHCTDMQQKNQQFPSDLYIEIVTGGVEPWESSENLFIRGNRTAVFVKWQRKPDTNPEHRIEFSITTEALNGIWKIIQDRDFFSLDSIYVDKRIRGGSYAGIFVEYNDHSHTVRTQNVSIPVIDSLISAANEIIPGNHSLQYSIPEK